MNTSPPYSRNTRTLCRLPEDGIIAGNIAGLANYLQLSTGGARFLFCLIALFTGVLPLVIIYLTLIFLLPIGKSLPLEKSSLRNRLQTFERVQRQIKTIEMRTQQIERYVSSGDFEIDSRL